MEDNIVPLFRTFEETQREEREILEQFAAEWAGAFSKFEIVNAVITDDQAMLAKFAGSEIEAAKAQTKRDGSFARLRALGELTSTLRTALEKRNTRLFGNNAIAKRSLRFARARLDQGCQPGGVV